MTKITMFKAIMVSWIRKDCSQSPNRGPNSIASSSVRRLSSTSGVKFNNCFVVENLKIVQGSKGLFLGMPSQPDGKGGYRDMAYPVTKEFREQLNTAVLQAYEAKLEQMAERGSVGRASISDQLKAGKAAAEQAKAERPPKEKPSRGAER